MWPKAIFKVRPVAGPEPRRVQQFSKSLGACGCQYFSSSHQPDEYDTRDFLGGSERQAVAQHSQKCLGPRRHSPMSQAPPRRVRVWGDGLLRFEDAGQGEPRPTVSRAGTHPTRSVYRLTHRPSTN